MPLYVAIIAQNTHDATQRAHQDDKQKHEQIVRHFKKYLESPIFFHLLKGYKILVVFHEIGILRT